MIAIVDYGMGNLRSVQKAFEHLGVEAHITSDAADLRVADAIVLPGVGAFGAAMERLHAQGLTLALRRALEAGVPFLGICLGLQLLFESSSESPGVAGLSLLRGRVVGFRETPHFPLRVPHMGWSRLRPTQLHYPLWQGIPEDAYVYFVHSYYPQPVDETCITAYCEYGIRFACAVTRHNIHAVQFHPEKSSQVGLRILSNFCALAGYPISAGTSNSESKTEPTNKEVNTDAERA
ncbi:MAG: imidazole glycerol phosphate synthase subunit HisH [Armatimonadota bacterium]|nr:imidazole glycerol phosphate synthase subunit HisH [Armatimonadota bacterium]